VKDNNYITIQGWMINKLNLKSNDLMLFAVIYGFSQDGSSEFSGSLKYIQDALNCTRMTAVNALKSLLEKGLINKRVQIINNLTFNHYSIANAAINSEKNTDDKNLDGGSKNYTRGVQNLDGGGLKIIPDNTRHITSDNNKKINKKVLKDEELFQKLWDAYPAERRTTKHRATKSFEKAVKTHKINQPDKFKQILKAVEQQKLNNWAKHDNGFKQMPPNLTTWLNNQDWEQPIVKPQRTANNSNQAKEAWDTLREHIRNNKYSQAPEALKKIAKEIGLSKNIDGITSYDLDRKAHTFMKIYAQQLI